MSKILVVEDEKEMNKLVCDYLNSQGFETDSVYDGYAALGKVDFNNYRLILLDIMLPGIDGLDILKTIRAKSDVPIIMVSAKSEENDKILGFEYGADDYVTKPFSFRELLVRVKALIRRTESTHGNSKIVYGDFVLDDVRKEISINDEVKDITAIQFSIIKKMLNYPGKVFSRKELLESFNEVVFDGYERNIDAHIKNIRKSLGKNSNGEAYIETVRGIGYKIREIV